MGNAATAIEIDGQYRALREGAGYLERPGRGKVIARGPDAAEYLQGQLTNDIEALQPLGGCYAALLDRKGHLVADMRVLRLEAGELWLDCEADATAPLLSHLATYKVGYEVEIAEQSSAWAIISVIGPQSLAVAAELDSGPLGLRAEYDQRLLECKGAAILAVRTDIGLDLVSRSDDAGALAETLTASSAVEVSEAAAEIIRIESGRPRFGHEMTNQTMPAEAGIVERAIDFEKGCYIGQEPVARLHYKGRPNRHLRGLKLSATAEPGALLRRAEKEVGAIGSSCVSPALGPIGLAVVRREAEPGDTVTVGEQATTAEISALPFAA